MWEKVVEDQKFEKKDEEWDNKGKDEEPPIMVSTVSTATATAATLTLQTRRSLGQPLRWMEQVKMGRQVNKGTSNIALSKGHSLSSSAEKGKTFPQFTLRMFCSILTNIFTFLI